MCVLICSGPCNGWGLLVHRPRFCLGPDCSGLGLQYHSGTLERDVSLQILSALRKWVTTVPSVPLLRQSASYLQTAKMWLRPVRVRVEPGTSVREDSLPTLAPGLELHIPKGVFLVCPYVPVCARACVCVSVRPYVSVCVCLHAASAPAPAVCLHPVGPSMLPQQEWDSQITVPRRSCPVLMSCCLLQRVLVQAAGSTPKGTPMQTLTLPRVQPVPPQVRTPMSAGVCELSAAVCSLHPMLHPMNRSPVVTSVYSHWKVPEALVKENIHLPQTNATSQGQCFLFCSQWHRASCN